MPPRFISTGCYRKRGKRGLPRSMDTSARAWMYPPIIRPGAYRYRDPSRLTRSRRLTSKMTWPRYSKKLLRDDGVLMIEKQSIKSNRKTCLVTLLFTLLVSLTASAQTPPSWEEIVTAAKKE